MINLYYLIKLNRHRDNNFGLNVMDTLTMRLTSLTGNLKKKMMFIQNKFISNGNIVFGKIMGPECLAYSFEFVHVGHLSRRTNELEIGDHSCISVRLIVIEKQLSMEMK